LPPRPSAGTGAGAAVVRANLGVGEVEVRME